MDLSTADGQATFSAVFEDLAEQALVGMTVVLDGRFIYANPKCCELFGYERSEFMQLSPLALAVEGERENVHERMQERLRAETKTSEYVVRAARKDGSIVELEVRGTTIEICRRAALATSFVDVTEAHRAMQERERQAAIARHTQCERDTAQRYLDVAGVMIIVFGADETIRLINRMGCKVLGYSDPDELVGRNWIDTFIPEPSRAEVRAAFHSFLDGASPDVENFENPVLTRAGDERVISWRNQRLFEADGKSAGILSSGEDITERRRAEVSLRASEARFRQIAENLHEVFWITNAEKTKVEYASPAYELVWGRPVHELYVRPASFLEAIVPEDREEIEKRVREQTHADYDVEYRIARPDGEIRWIHDRGVQIRNDDGRVYRLIGIAEDITERKQAEARLYQLAHFDQLTGLANRTWFLDRVDAELAQLESGTVILLDLDGFKKVNDSAGHNVGDLLLRATAERLAAAAPSDALISRWGGDEFALFVRPSAESRQLDEIVEAIHAVFTKPFLLPRRTFFISASLGIASAPAHGGSAEALLVNADLALYRAKSAGRATTHVFTAAMKDAIRREVRLEAELRRAFSNSEFELHYQPQVDLRTGALVGAEALLRWRHPQRGLLQPGAFISVLAQSPIAGAVGDWIVKSAVAAAERLYRSGYPLRIGVNLFSTQVKTAGLAETIGGCLRQHDVPAELLEIEITEKIALHGDLTTTSALRAIRDLGVGLAFDDYGTGYASLSMLTQYPLTRLKIDRAFVSRMLSSAGDAAIIKAIIGLGGEFGLAIIAEGIEADEEAKVLRVLGCHEEQGYWFGRAMPLDRLAQLAEDSQGAEVTTSKRRSA